MTCINCNGTGSHLLRMPSSSWLHITVPCEDCAAEQRGEVEHLDTRPRDRHAQASARFDALGDEAAWIRDRLNAELLSGSWHPDHIRVLRSDLTKSSVRRKRAWAWVLLWDELAVKCQRLGAQS